MPSNASPTTQQYEHRKTRNPVTDHDNPKVAKAFQGADFPADRQTLIDYAAARDAGSDTMQALRTLPEGHYTDLDQVLNTIARSRSKSQTG